MNRARPDLPLLEMPHSDTAERALLVALLLDNRHLEVVLSRLPSRAFRGGHHETAYKLMAGLVAGEMPVDLITLRDEAERTLKPDTAAELVAYLSSLMDGTARSGNVEY